MAKVDWITWKTEINEIIDSNKEIQIIKEKVLAYITEIETHVYQEINNEVTKGGLDKVSFDIMGVSPANETANEIVELIENMKQNLNVFLSDTTKQLDEQRQTEKNQLIEALEEKIAEERKKLENTQGLQTRLSAENQMISSEEVVDIIDSINERINMLLEKLNMARAI